MRKWLALMVMTLELAGHGGLAAQTLDQAASQAARQHDAKVLSAKTVREKGREVHVIKLLTRDGVVKTVRVPVRGK